MEKKYNKLVRDGIPEFIKNEGREAVYHILSDREFEEALNKKLFEEVQEVVDATGRERIEELADIYELIRRNEKSSASTSFTFDSRVGKSFSNFHTSLLGPLP